MGRNGGTGEPELHPRGMRCCGELALAGRQEKLRRLWRACASLIPPCGSPISRMFPLRRPEDLANWVEGLRLAGLPE